MKKEANSKKKTVKKTIIQKKSSTYTPSFIYAAFLGLLAINAFFLWKAHCGR